MLMTTCTLRRGQSFTFSLRRSLFIFFLPIKTNIVRQYQSLIRAFPSARMTAAKISEEPLWYEAKELLDEKELQLGKAYEGLFELNFTGFTRGEPLITGKKFKPIHYTSPSRCHNETVPIFNQIQQDICDTNQPIYLKDQSADAILRMQAKVELIEKRLNTLQDTLERLCIPKENRVSHTDLDENPTRWISDSKVFWFVWPIVTHFLFAS